MSASEVREKMTSLEISIIERLKPAPVEEDQKPDGYQYDKDEVMGDINKLRNRLKKVS